jgi:hypothetical protein
MNSLPFYPLVWKTASGTFRGSLTWDLTFSVTLTLIVAIGFVLLLVLQWRDLRQRVSVPVRWSLCLLRAVAYLLVLGMLVNPSMLIQKVLHILPPLVVMMDTSGSMALSEPGKPTRLQQVRTICTAASMQPSQRSHSTINSSCTSLTRWHAVPVERLEDLQAGGRSTDILGSLVTVLEEQRGTQPVGVFLLSDGAHHGADTGLGHLRQAGVRVVTVGVGAPETYRDIRIASVQAPTLAFIHYPTEVNVTVQTWGYRGEHIPVVSKRAGRAVATKTVQITADVFEQQVQFEIEPEEIGEFTYTVGVAPHLGEALTENNQADFPLSVARDKIRVLLVCGSPTWNYRFLRQGLKQDPSIDMISLSSADPHRRRQCARKPAQSDSFPTQRLFTQELKNFDLIIFENFSYQLYFPGTIWRMCANITRRAEPLP